MHEESAQLSKSQRKRDMAELRELGGKLLEFSADALRQLDIPEILLEALLTAQRISAHGARKRQLGYIGKLMATIDTEPVRAAVAAREHQHDTATREFHRLERLREELLLRGDDAVPEVLALFPQAERSQLRKLARQARQEQETGQPRGAGKALFRHLRELQDEQAY